MGQHVELAFDSQGRAIMLYLDATALVMKRAIVVGKQVVGTEFLPEIPAGSDIEFALTSEGAVKGVLGAWLENEAPRTRLETFELPPVQP